MFAIGERPTGSGDPYALRRAALGVIRIIFENRIRLGLGDVIGRHTALVRNRILDTLPKNEIIESLLSFIADRLKVALREKGTRHDLIDAVFSLGSEDDLVRLVARVEALQTLLNSDDGANLLTAYKRAANILKAEEKKDKIEYSGDPDPEAFVLPEEKALFVELATAAELIRAEVERERFVEAMGVMARLRKPVDAFFDKVTVNDKDPALRKNRLLLLSRLRSTLHLVADFSKIEG
jgi:glycyl-tRNA synthetase beta chain